MYCVNVCASGAFCSKTKFHWSKLTCIRQQIPTIQLHLVSPVMITANDDRIESGLFVARAPSNVSFMKKYDLWSEYFNCILRPEFDWLSHLKMISSLCTTLCSISCIHVCICECIELCCRYSSQVASARNVKSQSWLISDKKLPLENGFCIAFSSLFYALYCCNHFVLFGVSAEPKHPIEWVYVCVRRRRQIMTQCYSPNAVKHYSLSLTQSVILI